MCKAFWYPELSFIIITNCSNNYGPYQFPEKLIPVVILNALNNKDIPIYGTGENIRDWIHVDDHADALLLLLEQGKNGETYNIGCLLYTSDAADEHSCVDLGGRRIIKKIF